RRLFSSGTRSEGLFAPSRSGLPDGKPPYSWGSIPSPLERRGAPFPPPPLCCGSLLGSSRRRPAGLRPQSPSPHNRPQSFHSTNRNFGDSGNNGREDTTVFGFPAAIPDSPRYPGL